MMAAMLASVPTVVLAQTVPVPSGLERNLPPAPEIADAQILIDDIAYQADDETPLGVEIAGITVIGADDPVPPAPQPGIRAAVGAGERRGSEPSGAVDAAMLDAALAPFIGEPLSQAAIARMQQAVAGVWRKAGYPFMSVTVPPQEVTSGVLTLRVVEFSAGEIGPKGELGALGGRLPLLLRQEEGATIDAGALSEDLEWINRNPYREVRAVFAPGDEEAVSDIALQVTRDRPVTGFASFGNTGSEATGEERWSVGFGAWIAPMNDLTLSYRFTRDGSMWDTGEPFNLDGNRGGYVSHAGRIDLPTFPRQALSIAPNFVETNELVEGSPFSFSNRTTELPILYRSAISNILPGRYWGDVYAGVEPKWLERETSFASIPVALGKAGLFNIVVGWSKAFSDSYGRTIVDLSLKANPGDVVDNNTAEAWSAFTGGRVDRHRYIHADIDISRLTELPRNWFWTSRLNGLIADRALPDPERLSLGGHYAVRGYTSNDASGDAGFVWRNEIRMPSLPLIGQTGMGLDDRIFPFALVDLGYGHDFGNGDDLLLAEAGLGLDYAIGDHLHAGLTGAFALTDDGAESKAGDFALTGTISVNF